MMKVRKARITDVSSIVDFQLKMANETEGIELNEITVEEGVSAVLNDETKGNYYD